jgi:hypothetical protein
MFPIGINSTLLILTVVNLSYRINLGFQFQASADIVVNPKICRTTDAESGLRGLPLVLSTMRNARAEYILYRMTSVMHAVSQCRGHHPDLRVVSILCRTQ